MPCSCGGTGGSCAGDAFPPALPGFGVAPTILPANPWMDGEGAGGASLGAVAEPLDAVFPEEMEYADGASYGTADDLESFRAAVLAEVQAMLDALPRVGGCGGGGSSRLAVVLATTSSSLSPGDGFVKADATGGALTLTLPAAASAGAGKVLTIKKIDSSTNLVTVDGNGSETIDDLADLVLRRQYEAVTLVSDGSEWWIQSHST